MTQPNFALWSLKGGVGKSSISVNIAHTLEYGIVTNDIYSRIDKAMLDGKCLKLMPNQSIPAPLLKKNNGLIFDFGGYLDQRIVDAIKVSKYVMIPVIEADDLNIQGLLSSIAEIKAVNNNIVIILNKMKKEERAAIKSELKRLKYPYQIFEINSSKALGRSVKQKESIRSMVEKGGLIAWRYKEVNNQFEKLINFLTK